MKKNITTDSLIFMNFILKITNTSVLSVGEQDNTESREDCVSFDLNRRWTLQSCDTTLPFICKKRDTRVLLVTHC